MKLGKVRLNLEYTVDTENQEMVDHAISALYDDIHNLVKTATLNDAVIVDTDLSETLDPDDIPAFLKEDDEEKDDEKALKFRTHNDKKGDIDVNGTCCQGEIDISYKKLVKVFGEPEESDGYKVDAEWSIQFEDGEVATIYNYKDGKNYNGDSGKKTEKITEWHIGGNKKIVVERIKKILGY
jgi:hypothetical protein